jgi:hypothetical protein
MRGFRGPDTKTVRTRRDDNNPCAPPMRGQTQANGQRQLAGETVPNAIDAQLPPGRHVI